MTNVTKKPLTDVSKEEIREKNKKFFALYNQVDGKEQGNAGGKMRAIIHVADYCGVAPMTVKMNWLPTKRIPKRKVDNAVKAIIEVLNQQNQ